MCCAADYVMSEGSSSEGSLLSDVDDVLSLLTPIAIGNCDGRVMWMIFWILWVFVGGGWWQRGKKRGWRKDMLRSPRIELFSMISYNTRSAGIPDPGPRYFAFAKFKIWYEWCQVPGVRCQVLEEPTLVNF